MLRLWLHSMLVTLAAQDASEERLTPGGGMVQAQKGSTRGLLQNTCQREGWTKVYTVKKNDTDPRTSLVPEPNALYATKCPGHTPGEIAAASGIQDQNKLSAGNVICCPTLLTTPDSSLTSSPPPASPNAGTAFWTDWGTGPRAGFISGIVFVVCLFIAAAVLYALTQRRRHMRSQRVERHISSRSSGGCQAADYQSKAGPSWGKENLDVQSNTYRTQQPGKPRKDPKGLDPSNVVIGEVVPPLDGAAAHFSAMSPPVTSHASAASYAATNTSSGWNFDVFISHSGKNKAFAMELRDSLKLVGLRAFVDNPDLMAGNAGAHTTMIDSAGSAPVGMAVFSKHYFASKWPMLELRILVERGSLLPVLYSDMSHNDMEVALRSSPHRHVSGRDWDSYVQRVMQTTYVQWQGHGDYSGVLRQKLCWHVVRILATVVRPSMANSVRTGQFLMRVQNAAKRLLEDSEDSPFQNLTREESSCVRDWTAQIKAQLKAAS